MFSYYCPGLGRRKEEWNSKGQKDFCFIHIVDSKHIR